MATQRKGRQAPTKNICLRYQKARSLASEAIELYERSTGSKKRTAQRWQRLLTEQIMARSGRGLWIHTKYGFSVPRRNGKSEVAIIRILWGLKHGEKILYTAHRTTTSHSMYERVCDALSNAGMLYEPYKANGLERITSAAFEGRIFFRTRSAKGGLGEGFDLLIIDEAQEYTDDEASALKYVISDSKNPQSIFLGTPPTAVSAGTVFLKMREAALKGDMENTGWAEWSVDQMTDVKDRESWYETNPSLGVVLTERAVRDEIGTDKIDFNIQRLGLWLQYNQKSAISEPEWGELQLGSPPQLKGQLFVGVRFSHSGESICMSIAAKTEDGNIFVEAIDDRPTASGYQWVLDFIAKADIRTVVVDGANGQRALAEAMKKNKLGEPVLPTVADVIQAGFLFTQGITQQTIRHSGQYSLAQSVTNCSRRPIGSNGGYGFKSLLEDVDVALMESAVLAHWICAVSKEKKKQKIDY